MVSAGMLKMLRSLLGGDIAVIPPKEILGSAGGGMSESEAKSAMAEQVKAKKTHASAKKNQSKKKPRTEAEGALSAEDSNSSDSEDSDDSTDEFIRMVATAQSFDGEEGSELEDEEK